MLLRTTKQTRQFPWHEQFQLANVKEFAKTAPEGVKLAPDALTHGPVRHQINVLVKIVAVDRFLAAVLHQLDIGIAGQVEVEV